MFFSCNDSNLASRFSDHHQPDGSVTLYWLNDSMTKTTIREHIELLHKDGFKGIAPLPVNGDLGYTKPAYLTDDYIHIYGSMLDELSKRDMELIFYDDINFPTGTANGQFAQLYPEKRMKYLKLRRAARARSSSRARCGRRAVPRQSPPVEAKTTCPR